jgi:hypothetical protein
MGHIPKTEPSIRQKEVQKSERFAAKPSSNNGFSSSNVDCVVVEQIDNPIDVGRSEKDFPLRRIRKVRSSGDGVEGFSARPWNGASERTLGVRSHREKVTLIVTVESHFQSALKK